MCTLYLVSILCLALYNRIIVERLVISNVVLSHVNIIFQLMKSSPVSLAMITLFYVLIQT